MIARIMTGYDRVVGTLQRYLDDDFFGLAARFVFLAVLFVYYINSAMTKVGDGIAGFFSVQPGAYMQIVPPVMEGAGFDPSQVAFFPWQIIVVLGTYSEFLLPILIVIGLFTRLAALGMIVFVVVQSYVDVAFHGADERTIGALFDRFPDAAIMDQRLLWVFVLSVLVIKGGGLLSLDKLLRRIVPMRHPDPART